MKKFYLLFMLSAVVFNSAMLYSFPEKRLKWWSSRLKKIESRIEQSKNSGGPYSQIADLLEKDREAANKIISVLEADRKKNGALENVSRKYSEEELSLEADKTLKGIFSIYYLGLYSTEPNSGEYIPKLKKIAKKELSMLEKFRAVNDSELIISEAVEKKISPAEWKSISYETLLFLMKSDEEEIYSGLKVSILKELNKSISGNETNSKEIEEIILSVSGKYLARSMLFSGLKIKDTSMDNSSEWKLVKNRLSGHRNDNRYILDEFSSKSAMNKEYIQFVKDLAVKASAAAIKYKSLRPEFENSIVKSGSLLSSLSDSTNLDIRSLSGAVPGDAARIRELRKDFTSSLNDIRKEINSAYSEYISDKGISARKNAAAKISLDSKIAYYDLDTIINSAKAYAKYYESLNYSELILTKYATVHSFLMKDALKGNITQELDSVIKNSSILGSIEGFNREKFESEIKLKALIKKDLLTEIKVLNKLMDEYKHSGINLAAKPSDEEISGLINSVSKKIEIKIGRIIINESNLAESDAKAVKELALALNKNTTDSGDKNIGVLYKIDEIGTEIRLPYGWTEYAADSDKGALRIFTDWDGKSSISINLINIENDSLKEASDRWAKTRGITKLKSRWDQGAADRYWFQSKTKNAMVVDSYAFIKNGKAFIVSATCDKTRYNFYKEKLDELVNSAVK